MATQLFLRRGNAATGGVHLGTNNTTILGAAVGWRPLGLSTSRVVASAGTNSGNTPTVTGATAGVDVIESTGIVYEWLSLPLAADITISGTVTLNIWAAENNMSANVAINVLIERVGPTGSIVSQILKTARTTEVAISTTNTSVNNFTATPTSTNMTKGDRIRVRVFGDDAGTMATGFTFFVGFDTSTAAGEGDSWVQFNENLTFISSEPAGTALHLLDVAGPAVGANNEKEMWTSLGDGVNTAVVNTTNGWTSPIQFTDTAGGTAIEWYSRPLTAFTLSGPVLVNLWAHQSSFSGNVGIRAELAVCEGDGSGATIWSAHSLFDQTSIGAPGTGTDSGTGELATTTAQIRGYLMAPDVAVTNGQRLRLRVFIDDLSDAAMATGLTATLRYDASSSGSGDSFINLSQAVSEFVSGRAEPRKPRHGRMSPAIARRRAA